jgi:DNA-directed RNA polymerase I, II, and III subunit RPABC2
MSQIKEEKDEFDKYSDTDSYVSDTESNGGDESVEEYSSADEEEPTVFENTTKITELDDNDSSENEDDEEEEEEDEDYLQKLDDHYREKVIENHHPELKTLNYEEIEMLATVIRDKDNIIIDPLHKTIPILSRYEKARILGERAKQLNMGAKPMIEIEETMIDGYLVALKELEKKAIPFIIQRPLPNGGSEYWRLSDLEILS